MYLLKENSGNTEDPYFTRLPSEKEYLFFPEISVAKWFYESGIAEKNLIHFVMDHYVTPEKNVIDIGAHVGTYSWTLGRKANHTYAFECNPKVFCYLAANIAIQGLEEKITPYRYALGNKEEELDYIIRSNDGGGNGVKILNENDNNLRKLKIECKTLDSFNLKNVGFIKMDVEGFEKEVIEGSLNTLTQNNYPPILFESWGDWKERDGVPARKIREELFDYFRSIGYNIITINGYNDMYLAIHH